MIPGIPHHVTQRGNDRQTIFFDAGDYRTHLGRLAESVLETGVRVLGYYPRIARQQTTAAKHWCLNTDLCGLWGPQAAVGQLSPRR